MLSERGGMMWDGVYIYDCVYVVYDPEGSEGQDMPGAGWRWELSRLLALADDILYLVINYSPVNSSPTPQRSVPS